MVCGSSRCSEDWLCADCGSRPEVIDGFPAFAPSHATDDPGFREDLFAELADLEAGNFWFRARNDVIEHIDADRAVLEEIARALRPGGGLLLTVPQHPALWSPQDDHAHHVRRYTRSGLRRRVEAAGFEIVRVTSFTTLLLPMLAASRLRKRRQAADTPFDVIDELRQPALVDLALEAVMSVERALIRAGLSFPAGGSLLVVARRSSDAPADLPVAA